MRVREQINRGGFGRVDLVELDDGSLAARKTFDPTIILDSDAELQKIRKRFIREISIQSSLDSPSFVPILEYDPSGDNPWFLMPLAEKNFAEEISEIRTSGVAPQQALADILNALEELHGLGFVHRDLKPENILCLDGLWRLTDFGLVLPPSGSTTKLTSYASNWGTVGYCAPEQAIEFRNATEAVDVYAFGCILHDIYGNQQRVPYQQQTADGPIGLIIERCTDQKAEKRFKSIQALRGALLTLLSTSPNVTASPSANEWVSALSDIPNWNREKFEEFAAYIRKITDRADLHAIFHDLDDDQFAALHSIDPDLWKTVAIEYASWVEGMGFAFSYCDVIVRRLEALFDRGDLDVKAQCALAAAELGRSHNRFFVMNRVLLMCGPDLPDNVAQRIRVEIMAAEVQHNFRGCADVMEKEYSDYHSAIAEALQES